MERMLFLLLLHFKGRSSLSYADCNYSCKMMMCVSLLYIVPKLHCDYMHKGYYSVSNLWPKLFNHC